MWICSNINNQSYGTGDTPQKAYEDHNDYHGDDDFECFEFYEVTKPTPMQQAILPKEVIIPVRSKK